MNEKILVAYASQTGFTAGVAEAIAGVMKENGAQVDVRRMKDIDDVTPYRLWKRQRDSRLCMQPELCTSCNPRAALKQSFCSLILIA